MEYLRRKKLEIEFSVSDLETKIRANKYFGLKDTTTGVEFFAVKDDTGYIESFEVETGKNFKSFDDGEDFSYWVEDDENIRFVTYNSLKELLDYYKKYGHIGFD